ncbi:MAG: hypothetical protein GC186_06615 [Rhodobacteraceae bacterium]|nr:hypothetical protein [Paracoccaceae bacterium]
MATTINGPTNITLSLGAADSATVTAGGSITVQNGNTADLVYADGPYTGTVQNSGALTYDLGAAATAYYVFGPLGGTIQNDGSATVHVVSTGTATARGVFVNGDGLAGSAINNTGTLAVSVNQGNNFSWDNSLADTGITIAGNEAGTITNSGTLTVSRMATADTSAFLTAYGVNVYGDLTGSITNSGDITVTQTVHSSDSGARDTGIIVGSVAQGASISNSGNLTVTNTMNYDESGSATGIYVDSGVDGTISNSGTVTVTSYVGQNYSNHAYGIQTGDVGATGAITNSGTMAVAATGGEYAYAYGLSTDNVAGAVTNSGTLSVDALATYEASAYGIAVGTVDATGSVTNSGTLTVKANGYSSDGWAEAVGIAASDVSGAITNSGSMTVTALANSSSAYAYGIRTDAVDQGGSITNSGSITAYAQPGYDEYGSAVGIYVGGNADGNVTNSGSITANVVAGYYDATALGIYIDGAVGADGVDATVSNSGSIVVTAVSGDDSASAIGIEAAYIGANGAVTNSGTIAATATAAAGYNASAAGIYVLDGVDVGGVINSSGTITATANGMDADISASGIYVDGQVAGSVSNSGHITATANELGVTTAANASATGIYVTSLGVTGSITNSGSITANANVTNLVGSGEATAYGIYLSDSSTSMAPGSTVANSGTIRVTAQANGGTGTAGSPSAQAVGILANGAMFGDINNSGTILATASVSNTTDQRANAAGIGVEGLFGGSIESSGTISAAAYAGSATNTNSGAFAGGVLITQSAIDGTITLNGRINATATGDGALAAGLFTFNDANTTITNSGTILATATANAANSTNSWVDGLNGAIGIGMIYADGSTVINSGTITADFTNNDGNTASGLYGAAGVGVMFATADLIANTGTINVSALDAPAAGIAIGNIDGSTVFNGGTIRATESGTGTAYGIYIANADSTMLVNTGRIIAEQNGDIGTAIDMNAADGSTNTAVQLASGGFIEGYINLAAGIDGITTLDVVGTAGASVDWSVDGTGNATGGYTVNQSVDYGVPVFASGLDGTTPEFATIDASQFAGQRDAIADAGAQSVAPLATQTDAALATGVVGKFKAYAGISNSAMTYAGTGTSPIVIDPVAQTTNMGGGTLDQKVRTSTVSAGGTVKTDSGLVFGLGVGGQSGSATVNAAYMASSKTTYNGGFGGVSVAAQSGAMSFNGALTAGVMSNTAKRYINDNLTFGGIDTATATYNSTFVTAQLGVTGHVKLGNGLTFLPEATIRYTSGHVDAYTETGANAAASVGAQSFGVLESELGLNLQKELGTGVMRGGISVISRTMQGDKATSVTMIGDTNSVSGFASNTTMTKLSLGYTAKLSDGVSFDLGASKVMGSGSSSGTTVSGQIRFSF